LKYLELSIHTTTEASELVAELAVEEGASGVSIYDRRDIGARGEYAKWDVIDDETLENMPKDVIVRAVFLIERRSDAVRAAAAISSLSEDCAGYPLGTLECGIDERDDAEWADNWKVYFKPFKVGNRLVVKPAWEEYAPGADELVLDLDPGMAFGTGTHQTTALCLMLLEELVGEGERVIDMGCGSGILAIAAVKLGASSVLAVDFDPDAVRVARANADRNGMTDAIITKTGDLLDDPDEELLRFFPCDILTVNILAAVIIRLAPSVREVVRPGGLIIASGIIRERADDVTAALTAEGFDAIRVRTLGEWVALAARRT